MFVDLRKTHHLAFILIVIAAGLGAVLLAPGLAHAQVRPAVSDPFWQASYWNNMGLAGAPALTRQEAEIDYNWGNGQPAPGIGPQQFSARWTRYLYFPNDGLYRFTINSDDGARLFIDDQLVVDAWYDHAAKSFIVDRNLRAGHHLIRVEYYNNASPASVRFTWEPVNPPPPALVDWRGEYFNNRDLLGTPVLVRSDPNLDFNWGRNSPAPGVVNDDNWSARWTRTVNLAPGTYRFQATVDDGVRVFANGRLLIDQWRTGPATTFNSADVYLAGAVALKVEYFDATYDALLRVTYQQVNGQPPPPETWRGEYFNSTDLSGSPALVRNDPTIDFDWGFGSPAPGVVSENNFTVRWNRNLGLQAGNYRFTVLVDDGARLWVNNALIIDQWKQQAPTQFSSEIYVPGGSIPVRLEYLELNERAVIKLWWERIGDSGGGGGGGGGDSGSDDSASIVKPKTKYLGEYFNNRDLSGGPALVREDRKIDFDWGSGQPAPGIGPNNFSVRWTNRINFSSGVYRFTTETDDGVRLWVDDQLLIDQWKQQARTKYTAEKQLKSGHHTVRMEYFNAGGVASAELVIEKLASGTATVGNLITCVPPQPKNYAWIKLYRLNGNNNWYSIARGIGSINPTGFLKIDGLPVDINRFGGAGEPYKVEQWVDGRVVQSTGDFLRGQPEFRIRPYADNYTPWQCPR